jgi:hypothetical protein
MKQTPWPQDKHPWFQDEPTWPQGEPPWLQCEPSWLRLGLHDSIISISTRAAAIVVGGALGHYLILWITEADPHMCKTTLEPRLHGKPSELHDDPKWLQGEPP